MISSGQKNTAKPVKAAFGAKNRKRLIDLYFTGNNNSEIEANAAWRHVYGLLLWIDQTTGLAHCYESDKSQPGKNWYARTLAFHDWLSQSMEATPKELHSLLDWLFIHATGDLTAAVLKNASKILAAATRQRAPYAGRGFPDPGEDPELVTLIEEVLSNNFHTKPTAAQWQELVQRVRAHFSLENKRKNLLGEGFEDVIAQVVRRSTGNSPVEVYTRSLLQDLPGFANTKQGEKPNKVDLAIIRPNKRILVTAKWSVRADRERQFVSDYNDYVYAESQSKPWEYVFITNEFDPARLKRACDQLAGNTRMFSHVVHINTDGLSAAYGETPEPTMRQVLDYIKQDRLISLEQWIKRLQNP